MFMPASASCTRVSTLLVLGPMVAMMEVCEVKCYLRSHRRLLISHYVVFFILHYDNWYENVYEMERRYIPCGGTSDQRTSHWSSCWDQRAKRAGKKEYRPWCYRRWVYQKRRKYLFETGAQRQRDGEEGGQRCLFGEDNVQEPFVWCIDVDGRKRNKVVSETIRTEP